MKRSALPAGMFAILVLLAAMFPLVGGAYGISVGMALLGWVALTQSWSAFSGMTGYVSLGHAVFYGLGAYVMALGWQGAPLWLVVPGAGVAAGVLALVTGFPALRVRGPYFVILTFGLSEFVKYAVIAIEASLGATGRILLGTPDPETLFYGMLGLAVAASAITWWLSRSRFGAGLRAIRADETAAATLGVPTMRFKLLAFTLSAIIPGMVGALSVLRSTYFEPLALFNPITSFTIVSMSIIGGADHAGGPILGAAFIVLLSELLWARAPQLYLVLLGLLVVLFVLFVPDGITGVLARRRRAVRP